MEEHRADGAVVTFSFARQRGERWADYLTGLLGTFKIGLVHLHNISGCREGLFEALGIDICPEGVSRLKSDRFFLFGVGLSPAVGPLENTSEFGMPLRRVRLQFDACLNPISASGSLLSPAKARARSAR